MRLFLTSFFIMLILASCGKIPAPSVITPELSRKVSQSDYGDNPSTYSNILKNHLIKKLENHRDAKVEFVNEPQRMSIDHLGNTYSGYRVCLSVNEMKDGYYRGWRNHFFMIKNNEVTLHLYDSGLLTIPFEYCITRDTSKTMLVQNIPDSIESNEPDVEKIENAKSIEEMDKSKPTVAYISPESESVTRGNKFILCNIQNKEVTFVFNESSNMFYQFEFENKKYFEPTFTEILIAARSSDVSIDINRVSGFIEITTEKSKNNGKCDILDRTRF